MEQSLEDEPWGFGQYDFQDSAQVPHSGLPNASSLPALVFRAFDLLPMEQSGLCGFSQGALTRAARLEEANRA